MYRWGIIALDCGLGKTLSTLVHIITSTQHKFNYNALNPDDKKIFRATLVVCPAGAIEIWHADIEKFFPKGPLKIYQFFGTPKTVPNHRLSNLIQGGVDELNTFLNDLDPSDPQVGFSYWYGKSRCPVLTLSS